MRFKFCCKAHILTERSLFCRLGVLIAHIPHQVHPTAAASCCSCKAHLLKEKSMYCRLGLLTVRSKDTKLVGADTQQDVLLLRCCNYRVILVSPVEREVNVLQAGAAGQLRQPLTQAVAAEVEELQALR
jgi:hypothetical protein